MADTTKISVAVGGHETCPGMASATAQTPNPFEGCLCLKNGEGGCKLVCERARRLTASQDHSQAMSEIASRSKKSS